ncbi:MAG: hypothetical protein ACI9HX_000179 [Pseudoalteromonas tetraodonis]|jgi:hypothetical protein
MACLSYCLLSSLYRVLENALRQLNKIEWADLSIRRLGD